MNANTTTNTTTVTINHLERNSGMPASRAIAWYITGELALNSFIDERLLSESDTLISLIADAIERAMPKLYEAQFAELVRLNLHIEDAPQED
ncbi:MAG: hypothetical protein SF123_02820 [Chloroflexota bacterium]|nr:hypothetical protein [Chloroflexota bacterium]